LTVDAPVFIAVFAAVLGIALLVVAYFHGD